MVGGLPYLVTLQVLHLDFRCSHVVVESSESPLASRSSDAEIGGRRFEPSRAAIINFGCSRRSADGSFVYSLYGSSFRSLPSHPVDVFMSDSSIGHGPGLRVEVLHCQSGCACCCVAGMTSPRAFQGTVVRSTTPRWLSSGSSPVELHSTSLTCRCRYAGVVAFL